MKYRIALVFHFLRESDFTSTLPKKIAVQKLFRRKNERAKISYQEKKTFIGKICTIQSDYTSACLLMSNMK